ncbi:MAG: iron-sulfur cluster assembly scaffold protein [Sweet potato little leaf phytoplasma]|uniref:Iron-sulfur cluster assembly scaffold protein n=2 Tax=Candidatus Phytoplasma TaxID=33926 RepID=A0ABN0J848_PEWBP|nr:MULTISPECIES: iron-sulfur cluster assembly scaffold protein [Phytoplasma]MDV3201337.1 iron-sulfur cluster assembly scaffold protein [Candidatus Phytoplasma australasiaticum]QLL36713.1 iron-sulfur cluster assembly scaffold protein ['Echinacea purpurea' witches'-broom phytoplasma]WEX20201.1 MAG: iron-sulfur cluster assembly scaffold protein [Candidatus Phytoplasma aurantifolia]EMR14650.1 iron-sulfur cluster assembly scaffold protein [Peanut witches'-broom phytoplasma NTU2011]MDO7986966.1 iron
MVNYLLYRELIITHSQKPCNYGLLPVNFFNHCLSEKKHNLLCGDEVILQIFFNSEVITTIRHETKGCSIICASSSLMSIYLSNKTFIQSLKVINNFVNMLKNKLFDINVLEKDLLLFQTISNFPNKFNCASIPWLLALNLIKNHLDKIKLS